MKAQAEKRGSFKGRRSKIQGKREEVKEKNTNAPEYLRAYVYA